ncbi:hypothetical protein [Homoserinibacter sp. GY 40078]|uniref:hypothetical protein n=1 Tax=Homoserinibacter sp. GY 40078 TaxID=2603275 RepID=UPI0011C95D78|nr:hypothetical protein [Homoserinibacter sp. GY 40078]TXK18753.1 hypothetical protein FVQ89_02085 [Homoserinibacter sp. GY 40078]
MSASSESPSTATAPTRVMWQILDTLWRTVAVLAVGFVVVFVGDIDIAIRVGTFGHRTAGVQPGVFTALIQSAVVVPIVVVAWPTTVVRMAIALLGVVAAAWLTLDLRTDGTFGVGPGEWALLVAQSGLLLAMLFVYCLWMRRADSSPGSVASVLGLALGGAVAALITHAWFGFVLFGFATLLAFVRPSSPWRKVLRTYAWALLVAIPLAGLLVLTAAR